MKRVVLLVLVVALVMSVCGCYGRVAKEAFGAATGGKGKFLPVGPAGPGANLARYLEIRLEPFDGAADVNVPGDLNGMLLTEFSRMLRANKISERLGGTGRLIIRGRYLHYEESGAGGQLFGPLEEVVARVEMVDGGTNAVLARANCVGRSTSTTTQGAGSKAQGLAKGIIKFIKENSR
ncbi:MAG: hypothetical protein QF792_00380 [Phycisphaerae bacterium]|jgi:hypothetical protein|nr:hypothetical protein [Phycisphaerae bacterium]